MQQRGLPGAVVADHRDPLRADHVQIVEFDHLLTREHPRVGQVDADLVVVTDRQLGLGERGPGLVELRLMRSAQLARRDLRVHLPKARHDSRVLVRLLGHLRVALPAVEFDLGLDEFAALPTDVAFGIAHGGPRGLLLLGDDPLVFGVVATESPQVTDAQFRDLVHAVEQFEVVADHQDGAGESGDGGVEPLPSRTVEVVGRLVEQQHIGLGEQLRAQRQQDRLPTGEGGDGAVEVGGRLGDRSEPELREDRECALLDVPVRADDVEVVGAERHRTRYGAARPGGVRCRGSRRRGYRCET